MSMYLVMFGYFGSLFALISVCLQYKHLLNILLSLEAFMMSLFILLLGQSSKLFFSELSFVFISLTACEASLGLAILVYMIRNQGNDYVNSLSSQKC